MNNQAVDRSLNNIRQELGFLSQSGVLNPQQYSSIMAQLPQGPNQPSQYSDPHYSQPQFQPMQQQMQQYQNNPNSPANPQHKDHMAWAKGLGGKLANAAVFGAGATFGGDVANGVFHAL